MNAVFMECSAKTGENLHSFFKTILETLIKSVDANGNGPASNEPRGQSLDQSSKKKEKSKACC